MENNGQNSAVRRFSGNGGSASQEYKVWKKWARAWMVGQTARGVPQEALGPLLFTLLDGVAVTALEDIDVEELNQVGGDTVILSRLDERFPEPDMQDKLGEVMKEVFSLKIRRGERTAEYTGRALTAFQKAEKVEVKLPSMAKGYLVLRGLGLSIDRRAVVLAASNRKYDLESVCSAIRATFPELVPERHVHLAEAEPIAPTDSEVAVALPELEDPEVTVDDVESYLLMDDEAAEPIEESDAVDILATWKEQRNAITRAKLSRGFQKPAGSQGRSSVVARMASRVQCFLCKKKGHFSKTARRGPPRRPRPQARRAPVRRRRQCPTSSAMSVKHTRWP